MKLTHYILLLLSLVVTAQAQPGNEGPFGPETANVDGSNIDTEAERNSFKGALLSYGEVKTASFTAVNQQAYVAAGGTIIVTDPAGPTQYHGYKVHILSGSVTVGGTVYAVGDTVVSTWTGSVWQRDLISPADNVDITGGSISGIDSFSMVGNLLEVSDGSGEAWLGSVNTGFPLSQDLPGLWLSESDGTITPDKNNFVISRDSLGLYINEPAGRDIDFEVGGVLQLSLNEPVGMIVPSNKFISWAGSGSWQGSTFSGDQAFLGAVDIAGLTSINGASVIPGMVFNGAASQTANFTEFKNSGGTVLAAIDELGNGYFGQDFGGVNPFVGSSRGIAIGGATNAKISMKGGKEWLIASTSGGSLSYRNETDNVNAFEILAGGAMGVGMGSTWTSTAKLNLNNQGSTGSQVNILSLNNLGAASLTTEARMNWDLRDTGGIVTMARLDTGVTDLTDAASDGFFRINTRQNDVISQVALFDASGIEITTGNLNFAGDTILYRETANALRTPGSLQADVYLVAGVDGPGGSQGSVILFDGGAGGDLQQIYGHAGTGYHFAQFPAISGNVVMDAGNQTIGGNKTFNDQLSVGGAPVEEFTVTSAEAGDASQALYENTTAGGTAGFGLKNDTWHIKFRTNPSKGWFEITSSSGTIQHRWQAKDYLMASDGILGWSSQTDFATAGVGARDTYLFRNGPNDLGLSGDLTLPTGDVNLTAGNANLTAGDAILTAGGVYMGLNGQLAIGPKYFEIDGATEMRLNGHLEFHSMTDTVNAGDTVVVGYPGSGATSGPGIRLTVADAATDYWDVMQLEATHDFVIRGDETGDAMVVDSATGNVNFPDGATINNSGIVIDTGDQTIGGTKTFTSSVSVTGTAGFDFSSETMGFFPGAAAGNSIELQGGGYGTLMSYNLDEARVRSHAAFEVHNGLHIQELANDPANPEEGHSVLWQATGAGSGDDGDLMVKITAAASTTTDTLVLETTTQELTNKTLTNPTIKDYTESVVAIGVTGATHTFVLTNGTTQTATLTAATLTTFTMPAATAGKSFVLFLTQAAGAGGTATFTGVKWPGGTAPVMTATASKTDIFSFTSDGTSWYGAGAQNY